MNQKHLYLSIDFLTVIFPFVFSFYAKANFSKKWKYLWPAILIPGVIFLVWDEIFTRLGVWGFNENYLSGVYIGSLPIEEILFFVCIPYACVFTYEALKYLIEEDYFVKIEKSLSIVIILVSAAVGLINYQKLYTFYTFISLAIFLLVLRFKFNQPLSRFYVAYLFLLVPFFIVNGILTGSLTDQPVVWYNDQENLGIRLGTIPIEDIFYGMLLTLMNVSIFEAIGKKGKGVGIN